MKKCICWFMTLCVLISFTVFGASAAGEDLPFASNAKAVVLMDASTGEIIAAKNEHEKLYPASVTKIMPLLLFMEALDSGTISLDDTVTCSADAAAKGGSQIWLEEGEQMTVDELLRATAIGSANDACAALGEHLAGSEEGFVALMNKRAAELSMNDTHFDNCTGLDDDTDTHLTSAHDVAVMSRELLKHDRITTYTTKWMDSLRNGETELVNTNKLVRFYNGTTGLKTGTTSKAGYCVSASAQRDGTHLIAVVLGSDNSSNRFEEAKTMLNYGFANYETVTPEIDTTLIVPVRVIKGVEDRIEPQIEAVGSLTLPKGKIKTVTQDVSMVTDVEAPVEAGQLLGTITLQSDGKVIGEYKLTAPQAIKKLSFGHVFRLLISGLGV